MLVAKANIEIIQRPLLLQEARGGVLTTLDKQKFQTLYFSLFNEVVVEKSWDNLTQTAKFIIPRNLKVIYGSDIASVGFINPAKTSKDNRKRNQLEEIVNH